MEKNNTFIAFFRLLHRQGFVMTAFFWTLFINADSYEKNINNIFSADTKSQSFVDIYFSKKTLIQLEKIRRDSTKQKPSTTHTRQRNQVEINDGQKFFIFKCQDEAFVPDREIFFSCTQKNIQNTDAAFFTAVIYNNVNNIHLFIKKSIRRYIYNSFFSDRIFIKFLFSLPPPFIS